MKPPSFEYADPDTLDGLLAALADAGDDAAIIAGGQSLIPLLNLRLARPEVVIDPRRIRGLDEIDLSARGLRAGAMARIADLEEHPSVGLVPGLATTLAHIGHSQIRARTTVGGSIAHADPAAELPALLLALDGEVTLQSRDRGQRVVAAEEFFVGPLMTSRAADEAVVSVWFPAHSGRIGITEMAKRPGDFAIVGVIAGYGVDHGAIADPRVSLFGVAGTPIRVPAAENALRGARPGPGAHAAAAAAVLEHVEPRGDVHGSSDYRRHVAATLVERTLGGLT